MTRISPAVKETPVCIPPIPGVAPPYRDGMKPWLLDPTRSQRDVSSTESPTWNVLFSGVSQAGKELEAFWPFMATTMGRTILDME